MQWALHILKKPIVTVNWLHQCWNEHRIVPQESFRVLPFSGLTICVTRIPAGLMSYPTVGAITDNFFCLFYTLQCVTNLLFFSDERKEMEKLISQNGGKYSAELTKKCTHLIADISFSSLYKIQMLILTSFIILRSAWLFSSIKFG